MRHRNNRHKNWFIPFMVFFICMGLLCFYQKGEFGKSYAITTNTPPILWSKASSDITKVVTKQGDTYFEASKINNEWYLSKPITTKADATYLYTLISNFKEPPLLSTENTAPKKLEDYGIDSNSTSISIYDENGKEYVLIQGKEANATNYYTYSPLSNTIYTIPKDTFDCISFRLEEWRDKGLIHFEKEEVTKIIVSFNNQSNTYLIDDTTFHDTDSVPNKLLDFLASVHIKNFVIDKPQKDLFPVYGLDNPTFSITLFLKNGNTFDLSIGNQIPKDAVCYAYTSTLDSIVTIPLFEFSFLKNKE